MIAILGGGISGLTAAYQLKKAGKAFVLLEASQTLGGKIKSIQEDGYTYELGPNTVLINNKEIKWLLDDLGLSNQLILPDAKAVRSRFVLKNGKIEPIPNSLSSMLRSKLFSFNTLAALLREPFVKVTGKEESLADFSRRRFGQQIYEDFISPFVSGIYAGDPEKMHLGSTLKLLKEAEEKHGSVLRGMMKIMKQRKIENDALQLPKQKIFTFRNGLQHLCTTLQKSIEGNFLLEAKISSIEKSGSGYQINYIQPSGRQQIQVSKIISCIPAASLSSAIHKLSPSTAIALSKMHYVPAIVVHLAYPKASIGFAEKAFGVLSKQDEPVPFLGILFNSRFFPHSSDSDKEIITVICGGYKNPSLIDKANEQIVEEVHHSLSKLLQISSAPEYTHVHKWKQAIPQYEMEHPEIEASIQQFEREQPGFLVGGNFYKGVSVSDSVKNSIQLAQRLINA